MSVANQLTPTQSRAIIYQSLIDNNIPQQLALIVTAQSGHETNGWLSDVYMNDNNAFGYGYDGNSYTVYGSVEDSVKAIVGYINRRVADGNFPPLVQITNGYDYADLLKNVQINGKPAEYFEDTLDNYAAGINRWYINPIPGIADTVSSNSNMALLLIITATILAFSK